MTAPATASPLALVVDRDALMRRVAAQILLRAGFVVHELDGSDDVSVLNAPPAHLLVVDAYLAPYRPGSAPKGLVLASAIASTCADLRVLVVSERRIPAGAMRMIGARAALVTKPILVAEFRAALSALTDLPLPTPPPGDGAPA
jgi:DNA-binding response OmpR family regulator